MLKVRIGVPLTGGRMLKHFADNPQIPVLFSANAFFGRRPDGTRFLGRVNLPPGLDAALDSAGFVAMHRYGRYPWSDEEYLDLVGAYPWAFYSCPDYCVEPEIANDRRTVRMRLSGTINAYYRVARKAADRGLPAPMPVLQGRTLRDYMYCAEALPCDGLVGLGSFCRRDVHGEDGIVHIVEQLSREFPQARWHLFGVKGQALDLLGQNESIASVDSMAWDLAARNERRTGRTVEFRMEVMHRWLQQNIERKAQAKRRSIPARRAALHTMISLPEEVGDDVSEWQELVEDGVLTIEEAQSYMNQMWVGWEAEHKKLQASWGGRSPA